MMLHVTSCPEVTSVNVLVAYKKGASELCHSRYMVMDGCYSTYYKNSYIEIDFSTIRYVTLLQI